MSLLDDVKRVRGDSQESSTSSNTSTSGSSDSLLSKVKIYKGEAPKVTKKFEIAKEPEKKTGLIAKAQDYFFNLGLKKQRGEEKTNAPFITPDKNPSPIVSSKFDLDNKEQGSSAKLSANINEGKDIFSDIFSKIKEKTSKAKSKVGEKITPFNKKYADLATKIFGIPTQYSQTEISGTKQFLGKEIPNVSRTVKPDSNLTVGKVFGGFIEDAMMSTLGSGKVSLRAKRDILKEGINWVQGAKTSASLMAVNALINTMKEEDITLKDMLISGGIGFFIGMWEPSVMVDGGDVGNAKNILKKYGFTDKDFKNPEILKSKWRNAAKTTHKDGGGSDAAFKELTNAYNKMTSAGVDDKWSLSETTSWFEHLWNKQGQTTESLFNKANNTFKSFFTKIFNKNTKSLELAPNSVLDTIINTPIQDTATGALMVKTALEAQKSGQNILIVPVEGTGKNIITTPEGINVAITTTDPTEAVDKMPTETDGTFEVGKPVEAVVQIKDDKTQEVEYKTIPEGQLEQFKKAIDYTGKSGIAGESIDGKTYHITAKTTEQMNTQGSKFTGEAKLSNIPAKPQPTKDILPTETKEIVEPKPIPVEKAEKEVKLPDVKPVKPTKTVAKKVKPTKIVKKITTTSGENIKASKVAVVLKIN